MIKSFIKAHMFLLWAFFCYAEVFPPLDFTESKKILLKLYQEHPYTFYCDCQFDKRGFIVGTSSSIPQNTPEHLLKLEWEHIVPASLLGRDLQCWNKYSCPMKASSNRQCCRKTSEVFNEKEANLYNLVPSIKLSNRARSNYKPGIVLNVNSARRVCKILIDTKKKVFEPDDELKGFIARTYLKMDQIYGIGISDKDRLLFQAWDMLYPKGTWEKRREEIINNIYGNIYTKENT